VGSFPVSQFNYTSFITGPNGVGRTDLGTLPGEDRSTFAQAINATGQVAGYSATPGGLVKAFITGPNGVGITDLGTLPGGDDTYAFGINNAGQVAGYFSTIRGPHHAFITGPNGVGMTDLGALSDGNSAYENHTYAFGINNAGQVVGNSVMADGYSHAFITGPNGVGMTDLGTLGGNSSDASNINDAGQAVGYSTLANGQSHAFITGPNGVGMTDLGTLDGNSSSASDINDAGQVVGYSILANGQSHAFITGLNGVGMTDLNSLVHLPSGLVLSEAFAINNRGQVLAIAIPEPKTYALMLAGLGLIGFLAWRQRSGNRI
jgi:probable HAF family extracellular repeat protein